jgi:hypothetical protein
MSQNMGRREIRHNRTKNWKVWDLTLVQSSCFQWKQEIMGAKLEKSIKGKTQFPKFSSEIHSLEDNIWGRYIVLF